MPTSTLANVMPVRVVGITDVTTISGLPTEIYSSAAVKDVVIVNPDPLPITISSGVLFYGYITVSQRIAYQEPYEIYWDTVPKLASSHYNLVNASGTIEFNTTGTYEISYYVTSSGAVGDMTPGMRTEVENTIQEDTGGGFVDIPGTLSITYVRGSGDTGKASQSALTFCRDFNTGDQVKLMTTQTAGNQLLVDVAANGAGLYIKPV